MDSGSRSRSGGGNDNDSESDFNSEPDEDEVTPKLLNRIRILEQQVSACMESQPLLYQMFNKCNALEQKMKTMKKGVDRCLAELAGESYSRRRSRARLHWQKNSEPEIDDDDQDEGHGQNWSAEDHGHTSTNADTFMETETKPYECKFCNDSPKQLFEDAEGLANHYSSQHSQNVLETPFPPPVPKTRPFNSAITKRSFPFRLLGIVRRHKEKVQGKKNQFDRTSPKLKLKLKPSSSAKPVLPADGPIEPNDTLEERTCPKCDGIFGNRYHMKRHLDTMHGAPSFACYLCGTLFRRQDRLKSHQLRVHGRISDVVEANRKRKRRRPKNPTVDADDKSKELQNSDNEESVADKGRVGRVLGGGKYVACSVCGKSITRTNIYKHMIIHTGARPFSCEICGARFRDSHDLRVHGTKHTGRKPYTCGECGWGSYKASALVTHKRSHEIQAESEIAAPDQEMESSLL